MGHNYIYIIPDGMGRGRPTHDVALCLLDYVAQINDVDLLASWRVQLRCLPHPWQQISQPSPTTYHTVERATGTIDHPTLATVRSCDAMSTDTLPMHAQ